MQLCIYRTNSYIKQCRILHFPLYMGFVEQFWPVYAYFASLYYKLLFESFVIVKPANGLKCVFKSRCVLAHFCSEMSTTYVTLSIAALQLKLIAASLYDSACNKLAASCNFLPVQCKCNTQLCNAVRWPYFKIMTSSISMHLLANVRSSLKMFAENFCKHFQCRRSFSRWLQFAFLMPNKFQLASIQTQLHMKIKLQCMQY